MNIAKTGQRITVQYSPSADLKEFISVSLPLRCPIPKPSISEAVME